MVNGVQYLKILYPNLPSYQFHLLREDTILKKVCIIQNGQSSESLLYDFSLPINGQYTFLDMNADPTTATLTKIDTVTTAIGKRRRHTYVANSKTFRVIEGMGALTDPLTIGVFSIPNYNVAVEVRLCCHANTMIYINGESKCCFPGITEINELNEKSDYVKIISTKNTNILNIVVE